MDYITLVPADTGKCELTVRMEKITTSVPHDKQLLLKATTDLGWHLYPLTVPIR